MRGTVSGCAASFTHATGRRCLTYYDPSNGSVTVVYEGDTLSPHEIQRWEDEFVPVCFVSRCVSMMQICEAVDESSTIEY